MQLVLKKFTDQDFEEYFRLVSDLRVMAMITERSLDTEQARDEYQDLLLANAIHPELGQFRVLDRQQAQFIGLAKLTVSDKGAQTAELGYMILPEYWGQGIGSEVAKILLNKAQQQPELQSLFAVIDPANVPSRKILVNHGFVSREFKTFDGLPGEVLERCL